MKIAILETGHFQYALTQAEVFNDCEKVFITTATTQKEMQEYAPELTSGKFFIIKSIAANEKEILDIIQHEEINLLMISPVFDSYASLKRITRKTSCKKIITTHNINTWFNGRFWSPNSYRDRVNMRVILKNCDHVAIEDFIYNHLKSTNDRLWKEYKFLYIPFTIFHKRAKKYSKTDNRLKVVLPGGIDSDRRRYEAVLEVIEYFGKRKEEITFSFAGKAKGEYGKLIQNKLDLINEIYPSLITYFRDDASSDTFRKEMETSDLVLSVSNKTFKGMGTVEYIGKTKPTAAIHDMITYELPGLLPEHLRVPDNLTGSVFNYVSVADLIQKICKLLDEKDLLKVWKEKAKQNSLNFTADKIRRGLPF